MQIFCGIDIIEISRFDAEHLGNQKFLDLCFTKEEQVFCFSHKNPAPHFAARFAAKEAVVKALSGFGKSLVYCAIEIKKDKNNRPYVVFLSDDPELSRIKTDVSLSHAESHAAASAVVYVP
ncbi:MAG TPA: holo-ACP synthase [Methanocorpusculum sp.]|nr:holo-ACP synthase [Methanocorpusculum sp.]